MPNKKDNDLSSRFHQFTDLRELIYESSIIYSNKVAFVTKYKGKTKDEPVYIDTTYKQLYEEMNYFGTALCSLGLKGKSVALVGENSYRWCVSFFAVSCGVGKIVPLDKLLQKEELESCLMRSEVKAVVCDKKKYPVIKEIKEEGNTSVEKIILIDGEPEEGDFDWMELLLTGKSLMETGDKTFIDAEIDSDEGIFYYFTSGTTSKSKVVMLTHRNLMSCNYSMNLEEKFYPDDVELMILPLHHCYGMSGLLTFLSQGMKNAFCDGLKYISKNLKEYKVSVLMSVPLLLENMHKKIIKEMKKQGAYESFLRGQKICKAFDKVGIDVRRKVFKKIIDQMGGNMRFIINGAAPLNPETSRFFNSIGILTVQGYGMTETSPTIASESYRYIRPGSVGKLFPFVEGRIIDKDEEGVGELIVKGDNVMLGYYDDPTATEEAIDDDGWLHTGDLAYFDQDGYLFLCGRKKNVIVMKNGKNVFPEEIETEINNLPYIDESMVFTKNKLNDVVLWVKGVYNKAYLKENEVTLDELKEKFNKDIDNINKKLPSYKMIKNNFLSEIPTIKTTTQKTKRREELKQIEKEIKDLF